ncbi:MAG TPA: PAS domain-containing protein, partial [Candidatus Krumholzibacteria bacterium]|nr:PAS domain-containing protein [Candidatus Krumholzibacteria bacterium]
TCPDQVEHLLWSARAFLSRSPADLDAAVAESLAGAGRLAGAVRCALCSYDGDCAVLTAVHQWHAAHLEPVPADLQRLDIDDFPRLRERLAACAAPVALSVGDLPATAPERAILGQLGVDRVASVPLHQDGRLIGMLGVGFAGDRAPDADDTVPMLAMLGDFLVGVLERQGTEAALRQSEERADVAVRGTGVALWEWNVKSGATVFDERWAEIIGYKLHELEPVSIDTWVRLVHPDDLAASNERLQAHFRGETTLYECEARMRHKSGGWVWVLDRGRVFERDADGEPLRMAGTHLDITERRHSEQERERLRLELLQVQKMESVGRLAGGVAHDFNNLLTVIAGYAEMMMLDQGLSPELQGNLHLILDAAKRAQDLTRQLLAFSRKQIIRPQPLDLNGQIRESLRMYRRLIGEDIALEFRAAPALPLIKADRQQLDQLVGNLLVNARDALHAGGGPRSDLLVAVDTKALTIHREDEAFYGLARGRYVLLTISDNGVGMDEATRSRIFDPFFSTKGRDKGAGLGLATAVGIVEQNGGGIKVYSEPGKGTTFRILWPVADPVAAGTAEEPAAEPVRGGNETILYVEDEPSVRQFTTNVLARLGYTVLCAPDGEAAISMMTRAAAPPHLLLTDVVLPRQNGREVAGRARELFPGIAVLYCSGYTDEIIARHGILEDGFTLIEKPYTAAALAAAIRTQLDRD